MSLMSDRIDTHRERNVREGTRSAREDRRSYGGSDSWNRSLETKVQVRTSARASPVPARSRNVPRAIFGFGRDPESVDGGCVMTQSKNSLGRSGLPSISYRIESATVGPRAEMRTLVASSPLVCPTGRSLTSWRRPMVAIKSGGGSRSSLPLRSSS